MIANAPTMITILVRYGAVPEVVRTDVEGTEIPPRGTEVVVRTHRGLEIGSVLEKLRPRASGAAEVASSSVEVVRFATAEDRERAKELQRQARSEFSAWQQRISDWALDLQLIDLEWTLDGDKLILYVLNERGPECTKLALQAAAAGLGIIEVQPVSMDGPVTQPQAKSGGGCGSGSCGCH